MTMDRLGTVAVEIVCVAVSGAASWAPVTRTVFISLVDKCSIAAGRNRDTGYCDAICGGDGWCRLQSAVNKQLHGIRNVSEWVQGDSFRGIRCKAVSTEIVIDGQIAKGCCAGIDNTENISDTVAGGISVRKCCF